MKHPLTYSLALMLLLLLHSNFYLSAQACISNDAGGFACDNVDLIGHIPLNNLRPGIENPRANDIWGWTDPTDGKEYALIGLVNGTAFVDISSPASPVLLGNMASTQASTSSWRDIKVNDNHAYVVSEAGEHHVQVFDLTRLRNVNNPPLDFEPDATFNLMSSIGNAHNIVINEETAYAYTVGTSGEGGCNGGPVFWNLSNPLNPSHEGCYIDSGDEKYSHDGISFIYRGPDAEFLGKEIYIGSNNDSYIIADITDKRKPTKLSENTLDQPDINKYLHQGWVTDDHRYFIMNNEVDELRNEVDNTTTFIIDITDLKSPFLKWTFTSTQQSIDHNLYVKGSYAYQSNYTSGLRILDISNLDVSNATEVAYFDTYPADDATSFNGTWSNYPYFKSGNLIVSDRDNGLFIVKPQIKNFVMSLGLGEGIKEICPGETATFDIDLTAYGGLDGTTDGQVSFTLEGLPTGVNTSGIESSIDPDASLTLTLSNTSDVEAGNYSLLLKGTIGANHRHRIALGLRIMNDDTTPTLNSPADNSNEVVINPQLLWNEVAGTADYHLEVASDPLFSNMTHDVSELRAPTHQLSDLDLGETYYWRVSSNSPCANFTSSTYSFTTISILHLDWIAFDAMAQEEDILLKWETSDEINNAGFEVQRRAAYASVFQKIGWVDAQKNNSSHKHYQYLDDSAEEGLRYYYRLQQMDLDESTQYSKVVSAIIQKKDAPIRLYPNPAGDYLYIDLLNLKFKPDYNQKYDIKITDISGKTVWQDKIGANNNRVQLAIDFLPNGIYTLHWQSDTRILPIRFVKCGSK